MCDAIQKQNIAGFCDIIWTYAGWYRNSICLQKLTRTVCELINENKIVEQKGDQKTSRKPKSR